MNAAGQTICLSMIVKNESPVIRRCLESVRPIIDYWVIVDTGSTDGTQDIIRDHLKDLPGGLHERPWHDFARNRSEALTLARAHADYSLIIDADDVLEIPAGFKLPELTADAYMVDIHNPPLRYKRIQLVRNALPWRYQGVLHEVVFCEGSQPAGYLPIVMRCTRDGARQRDPETYRKDAETLESALRTEIDPLQRSRYMFYLAQSYSYRGAREKALETYLARAELGFWREEVFESLLNAARIKEALGHPEQEVIDTYLRATNAVPTRAEALHGASRFCRVRNRFEEGYQLAKRGTAIGQPSDALFVEPWIYEYGLLDELAVNGYWSEHYQDSLEACETLLSSGKCPPDQRERVAANANFARQKLQSLPRESEKPEPVAKSADLATEELQHGSRATSSQDAPATTPAADAETNDKTDNTAADVRRDLNSTEQPESASSTPGEPIQSVRNNLHLLGVAHTIPHEDYLVCAFTAKVLLFPEVIQPFGWRVIEYSNEGSASEACEHVVILTRDRLRALSKRGSREEPLDADVDNTELQEEFQRGLVEKIRSRARPGDIVCHVWGPNMEVYNALPECRHIELSVGYSASPGLPFRVYESSAWMHVHYGKAGQQDGNHYKWVIPSAFDTDKWAFREEPDDYAIFLGRVTPRKGMNELVEIARRTPELPIHVYGPGDPSQWATGAPANLIFKGPVFGDERVDVVGRARCMLMPTVFIEPFGFSGIEAQLCGVPLIATSYGAFQETVLEGVTGYRCHTLADWVEAIRLSKSLDRRQIATLARSKYSKEVVGKQYDWVLRQLGDLSGRGWYGDKSRKFAGASVRAQASGPRERRIYLYMPYFGAFPNYFQLYLDSLGRNADCLSVFLMTDIDLSGYRVPDNLIPIPMTLSTLRKKVARFISDEFGVDARPDALLKQPYKFCDFRILYPELFRDVSDRYGVTEDDFVGWGDCDVIYGRFADFLDMDEDYQVIGGYHGHLTALRNTQSFRTLFREVANLPALLLDEKSHLVDEVVFRKPLLDLLERNQLKMFYINRYFCDIVPEYFFGRFRRDHARREKNFFDAYHPDKEIDHLFYDRDGRLTVVYDDLESRPSIYCHLQKRAMSMDFDRYDNGYYIREDAFDLVPD